MSKIAFAHQGKNDKKPLHYKECGLDEVYLVSGYEIEKTPHGEGLSIKNIDQLHIAIGRHLASQKKVLTGKELRFLRTQMGRTQARLGKVLGLSSQQVARYEKEESEISGPIDLLVRALYIQSIGVVVNIQKLSEALAEMDSPLKEKSFFENTSQGWMEKKAA